MTSKLTWTEKDGTWTAELSILRLEVGGHGAIWCSRLHHDEGVIEGPSSDTPAGAMASAEIWAAELLRRWRWLGAVAWEALRWVAPDAQKHHDAIHEAWVELQAAMVATEVARRAYVRHPDELTLLAHEGAKRTEAAAAWAHRCAVIAAMVRG